VERNAVAIAVFFFPALDRAKKFQIELERLLKTLKHLLFFPFQFLRIGKVLILAAAASFDIGAYRDDAVRGRF